MPEAIVIGGANGAGKTTFARELLPALYPAVVFLNTDEVQSESSAFAHPVAAGRELLRRLQEMERRRNSFYKPLVDEWYHWYSDDEGLRLGQYQDR
jgi:predicted ABC-type ATPase